MEVEVEDWDQLVFEKDLGELPLLTCLAEIAKYFQLISLLASCTCMVEVWQYVSTNFLYSSIYLLLRSSLYL